MRVSIVHDYCTQLGGAERVVAAWLSGMPDAPFATLVSNRRRTFPGVADRITTHSGLQKYALLRHDPRFALPMLPNAVESLRVPDGDVVLASSSGFAHGVRTNQPVVVYCHTPARWLYEPDDYFLGMPSPIRTLARQFEPSLRTWDQRAARRASAYLCNSTTVRRRIRRVYGIEASVVPPPVVVDVEGTRERPAQVSRPFVLSVSRRRGYKQAHHVAAAARALDLPLVVVGWSARDAADYPNVQALPRVSDAQLRWLYANAECYATAAREDFGLAPIEANAFGTPVVCPAAGGFLDTQVDGTTAVLFDPQDRGGLIRSLGQAVEGGWDREAIRRNAERFSLQTHMAGIRRAIEGVLVAA